VEVDNPIYLTNFVAPEPTGSSLYLQEPATGPYPEPVGSTSHPPSQSISHHSDPILASTPQSSEWSSTTIL
jgi:hypothetical protein